MNSAMKAIGHSSTRARPRSHARLQRATVRAEQIEQRQPSRRESLTKIFLLPASIPALWNAAQQVASAAETTSSPVDVPPAPPKLKAFIGREFFFQYDPAEYKVVQDPNDLDIPPGGRRGERPVRAEVASLTGSSKITVVQSQAAKLKQQFLQVTDITKLGSLQEVVGLLLPPTAKVLAGSIIQYPQPPRDTGTVLGVIQRDPVTIYRYEVILPSGEHAAVAVGALLGNVFLLGAATTPENWDAEGAKLSQIADTFKLLPK